ncbi:Putative uncharacterized protein [Taphrina deformans PYCC 5710]|uniref:Autophagy-related protein 101 n=1 Tax=Taphrina deformans (strain PYCC 5710 / ATCC 11124 / CBS 356.35 / IMI 108563 / JCM 9778 / NBRC 8474) TaxID=1097556 RepID=R4XA65_TAPDE|nr:Putative uncharacterized protein [Taphrina deformans PYCC 5710]|eukprot:CCG81164.1 Putative uncharacterized protein [Taphrina deformans PYCC 5710]
MDSSRLSLTIQNCEYSYVKEVTKALLHTILFHRQFGQISPKTQELLDLTIASIDDGAVESMVEERASAYIKSLHDSGIGTTTTTMTTITSPLVVEFYEKKTRKAWFTTSEEEVCWESWTLNFELIPTSRSEPERKRNLKVLVSQLEDSILRILTLVNKRNEEYIPPIPYSETRSFPYQIIIR